MSDYVFLDANILIYYGKAQLISGNPTLGSGLIEFHSQNITVAARATAERKTFGHLS
jgi:hypothetical protein